MVELWKVTKDELVEIRFFVLRNWLEFIHAWLEWAGYRSEEERQGRSR